MPFIPIPDCVKVEMLFTQNGETIQNVYHVRADGAVDLDYVKSVAMKFADWWDTYLKVYTSASCSLWGIDVTDQNIINGAQIHYTTGMPIAGTGAASTLPNSVTVAIKLQTGFSGRSYRGRVYHCGIVPSWVTGNTLASGVQANCRGAYMQLLDILYNGDHRNYLVVASRRENNAWRTTGIITDVVDMSVENNVDNQRRRLSGPGRS